MSFAGRPYAQIQFVKECCTSAARINEILENRDVQPFSLIICNKSRIASFTALNLKVLLTPPPPLPARFDRFVRQRVANFRNRGNCNFNLIPATFNILVFIIFSVTVLTEIFVVYELNKGGFCSARNN